MHASQADARRPAQSVALVAVLGPQATPVGALLRTLLAERAMVVDHAFFIAGEVELEGLHRDLLDSGRALDRLREAFGDQILDHDGVHIHTVRARHGDLLAGDLEPEPLGCLRDALWGAAREAIARAGPRPVIFALVQGIPRTAVALTASFYQLLGRPQDLLLDVRLLPEIDGFGAARLIDLELPRFGGVLGGEPVTSFESAVQAAQARTQLAPPQLVIDLRAGTVEIDGCAVDLSPAECLWYAYLARLRGETTDGWVLAGQDGHERFAAFLKQVGARRRTSSIRSKPLRELLEGDFVHDEDLRNLRGKTVQRMKRWCARHRPEWAMFLVPEADNKGHQRIPLPRHCIEIRGLPRE